MSKSIKGDPKIDEKVQNLMKAIRSLTDNDLKNTSHTVLLELGKLIGAKLLLIFKWLDVRKAQTKGGYTNNNKKG